MSRAVRVFFNADEELRSGWKAAGFLLACLLLELPLFGVVGLARHLGAPAWLGASEPWISAVAALAVTWSFCRWEERPWREVGLWFNRRWSLEALMGVGLGAGLIMAAALLAKGLGGFHWESGTPVRFGALVGQGAFFIGVAINEELVFRGYPFQRLVKGLGVGPTQILAAGFFALVHWGNPNMAGSARWWGTLNIALAAVLLGLAYLRTRSLALPMGIHLGWNWMQALLGFGVSGTHDTAGLLRVVDHDRPAWVAGGAFGLEGSLPCALICLVFILGLLVWRPRAAE